jgi:hypothetical protein
VWWALVISLLLVLLVYLAEPVRVILGLHEMQNADWLTAAVFSLFSVALIALSRRIIGVLH